MRSDTPILIAHYYYYYPFFYSANGMPVGVAVVKNQDGDRRWLAFLSRDGGIKRRGSRCCVYSNTTERSGNRETMRKRSRSIQPHGSSTPQTSCAADSQVHLRDLHCCCPQRHVLNLAGRVFSRTGSWKLLLVAELIFSFISVKRTGKSWETERLQNESNWKEETWMKFRKP